MVESQRRPNHTPGVRNDGICDNIGGYGSSGPQTQGPVRTLTLHTLNHSLTDKEPRSSSSPLPPGQGPRRPGHGEGQVSGRDRKGTPSIPTPRPADGHLGGSSLHTHSGAYGSLSKGDLVSQTTVVAVVSPGKVTFRIALHKNVANRQERLLLFYKRNR